MDQLRAFSAPLTDSQVFAKCSPICWNTFTLVVTFDWFCDCGHREKILCVRRWASPVWVGSLDETNEQSVTPAIVPGADAAARFPGFQQVADSVVKFLSVELGDTCVVSLIDESGSILDRSHLLTAIPDANDVFREIIARRSVGVGEGNAGGLPKPVESSTCVSLPGGSVPRALHLNITSTPMRIRSTAL